MYSQIETFSPDKARAILDHRNPRNRPLSRVHVAKKADEMRAGRWKLNPQGISFDRDGNLLDGQHTLAALIAADATLDLYVHHDVDPSAQGVMDQGLIRTAAQVYAMETGTKGASRYTSAARAVLEYGLGIRQPSNTQIVQWAQDHAEELERFASLGRLYTTGTHAAFVFAALTGLRYVDDAAARLTELRWSGDDDPMRALARSIGNLGGRDGGKAKQVRFFTTLAALHYVDQGEGLLVARKFDAMPARVRESVRPELAA